MIVTLCGSTRFEQDFIEANRELSRRGVLCFTLAVMPRDRQEEEGWADGQFDKTMADLLYFKRIAHSDAIIVLGDGYIGQSTSREIMWAYINGKPAYRQRIGSGTNWDELVGRIKMGLDHMSELFKQARQTFAIQPKEHIDNTGQSQPFGYVHDER